MANNLKRLIINKGTLPNFVTLTGTVSSLEDVVTGAGTTGQDAISLTELERTGQIKVGDWLYCVAKNVVGTFALRQITAILDDTHLKLDSKFSAIATPGTDSPILPASPFTIVRASRAVEMSYNYLDALGGILNGIIVSAGYTDTESKSSKTQRGQQDFIDPIAVDGLTAGVITRILTL